MTKLLKILGNTILILIEIVLISVIAFLFLVRLSFFQTFIAHKASEYLEEMIDSKVSIGKVDIAFLDQIYLDEVYVEDQHQDTLFYIQELFVNYSFSKAFLQLDFQLDNVEIKQAKAKLIRYEGEKDLNLKFFIDAFKSDKPKDRKVDFKISIDDVSIVDSYFLFHDQNKESKDFGVDFTNLEARDIQLLARNVVILPKEYQADFDLISFHERSGFELEKLKTAALFNDKGLRLKNANINTKSSIINLANFEMVTESLQDYKSFIDIVQLNSDIDTSYVSLKDISYFAPQLQGMDDIVVLSGNTRETIQEFAMNDIYLKLGRGTVVKGDFTLPDFRALANQEIHQKIDYVSVYTEDLERLRLPDNTSTSYIQWPEVLSEVKFFESRNLSFNGRLNNMTAIIPNIHTNVGDIWFDKSFSLAIDTTFKNIHILPNDGQVNFMRLANIEMNQLLKDKNFGKVNGSFGLKSVEINPEGVRVKNINGILTQTELYNYKYDYIIFDNVNYTLNSLNQLSQNEVAGEIYVRDENLDLSFNGFMSIGNFLEMKARISVECAMLEEIHPTLEERGELITNIMVDARGKDFTDFEGHLMIDSLYYEENNQVFKTTDFNGYMVRNQHKDSISISSGFLNANVNGKIDYEKVAQNIQQQITAVFPTINLVKREEIQDELTVFDYNISVNNINNLLVIFFPDIQISDQAQINGFYNGKNNHIGVNIDADYFQIKSFRFNGIEAFQEITNQELIALISVDGLLSNDSLIYKNVHFTGLASNGGLDSQLLFDDLDDNRSDLEWFTNLKESNYFEVDIYPSHIIFNKNKWEIKNRGKVEFADSCYMVSNIKLEYKDQYIGVNGNLSSSPFDRLYIDVMNLNLDELSSLFLPETKLSGIANVSGYASALSTGMQFNGEAVIEDFFVNESEVGVVGFGINYNANSDRVGMYGDIFYRNIQTFNFGGYYVLKEETEAIGTMDFDMIFKKTKIDVVSEFLDPEVFSALRGNLEGNLKLTGTLNDPVLTGKVNLNDGLLNLAILGADMYFDGEIETKEDGIFIHRMPIRDQEGNTGFVTATLTHDNFKDFNFEIIANLEEHPTLKMPNNPSRPLPVDRFLVMNTTYDLNVPYYGDGYITGIVTIKGGLDDLEIDVIAKTRRGTKFVLPLYGPTTIEEDGFVSFKKEEGEETVEKKVDLSGLDLMMNFEVTDDAEVKIIFDEKSGDELAARGNGNIRLSVNQFNELAMDGTFTVTNGSYNFVLEPYKQVFSIAPGGTVQWVGDPYEAILDINAYNKTTANLSVVMPNIIDNKSSNNEEIYSYLTLQGNMSNPEISFDIDAPNASESGRAIISRIRSDRDELNKQFFSLFISKSLMPLSGQQGSSFGSSGAFLDLASSQINNILNRMSDGYKMNVNLESDDFTGQFSGEFGLSKSFLEDRLLISGSFGVGTRRIEEGASPEEAIPNQNTFIGDVKIEYLLNEEGTFRMNVFNESNNNYILQDEGRGQFTQGVGLSYKEDFNNFEDFKLFQFIANFFRKKNNKVDVGVGKRNQRSIPKEYLNGQSILNEDE